MLEFIINPKRAEKTLWEAFVIGFIYSILAVVTSYLIFSSGEQKYVGIWIIAFTVILSTPFVYYLFKKEEHKDLEYDGVFRVLAFHWRGLVALIMLFFGFLLGYTLCYIVLPSNFLPQIETFCAINQLNNFDSCVKQYSVVPGQVSGFATATERFLGTFINNMQVLMITFVLSIIFGAGGILVLSWNAAVIASAIGIYIKSQITFLHCGLLRFMIHGIPEIAAYLFGALAGGIISIMLSKKDYKDKKVLDVLLDVLVLILIGVGILVIAGIIEVFITPQLLKFLQGGLCKGI